MRDKRKKGGCGRLLLVVAVLAVLVRASLSEKLDVKHYTVESHVSEEAHRYVVLADLHSTLWGEGQSELLSAIGEADAEAIFFVGDIGDDERDFDNISILLDALRGREMYYVTGNHEMWPAHTDDAKAWFAEYGVTVLDSCNSVYLGDGIRLFGIDDPIFYRRDGGREAFFAELSRADTSEAAFDILLSHRPEYAEKYSEYGFDLTLSGHAHGGQIRLPIFLNGLYAPNQGWFPEYAGGRYKLGGNTLIVSRGLMKNEYPRVFNRPEVLILDIVPEK